MLTVLLLLLATAALSSAKIDTIGPCNRNINADQCFSLDEFSKEHGGVWYTAKVPLTKFNARLSSLTTYSTPTRTPGVYDQIIKYETTGGEKGIFANETVADNKLGLVTAKGKNADYTLKIYFIKYVHGRYGYYYICSTDGGDTAVDYRYVTYHTPLTADEEKEIIALEKKYKFKGDLKDIQLLFM